MVVAIIGILASMAIMSLWRARAAANETSAIGSLQDHHQRTDRLFGLVRSWEFRDAS